MRLENKLEDRLNSHHPCNHVVVSNFRYHQMNLSREIPVTLLSLREFPAVDQEPRVIMVGMVYNGQMLVAAVNHV